jgi:hypothetical protein
MGIVQARDDTPVVEVDLFGLGIGQGKDVIVAADSRDHAIRNRNG